ncbi:DNA mismatch repair protein MutS [Halonotius terrestris]|uniref:DNA mismatch repair protein MutS n=1 Tax=Halonotius terrestris TaxID=2487750 RepID=A0A8J8P9A3_9EURY|nr:DNA mismatch repair protein MutS [Halonotius terrestris]TQQ80970.1 DNA mismatch repair protein MutS [Halonotius terrestris]
MTAVTGLPPTMADRKDDVTPMLSQYVELCEQHPDALVLFQVGDFYEAFCEAAEEVARVCEVTLTQREDSTGEYPMAGIPIDNAASYLERLVEADYRVALADQVEDAEEASGLVDRAVTRVITPGTVVEDELLAAGSTTYVASVVERDAANGERDGYGIAAVDASTGECFVTTVPTRGDVREELDRIQPNELLVAGDAPTVAPDGDWMESAVDAELFEPTVARDRLAEYVADPDRRLDNDAEQRACGAVLAYAEYTQGDDGPLEYVSRIRRHDQRDQLRLDAAALRSLELFDNRGPGSGETVFDVLDETASALGRRCLDRWLRRPLVDRAAIEDRLDAVDALVDDGVVRSDLSDLLAEAYDLERLAGRVSRERANARDLRALHATLSIVPELKERIADIPALSDHHARLDELRDVATLIDEAISPEPPMELTEGGVIKQSFDDELDALRTTEQEGREWVADLEATERERTGIDSLSVGHNQVHGYYIEVTNPNLDQVPDDYTRRQTLKNAERFYTPELKEREDEIFGAAERADSLEYELFCEVRETVAAETDRIQALATTIAELDALCSFSIAATEGDYVRPELRAASDDAHISIHGGRHPVVETTQAEFVPNDTDLAGGDVAIITGPNMSGKSTYMRQVALICLLAQTGSFVPAEAATLPVLDRIFTRVGASDDIAGGQSTFMREMSELTEILHDATDRSLVLLDEVGRGTSTADGLAIAQATTEFIHDELDATTLFATHYHGLTDLADEREGVHNLHFAATREGDDVTFLHRVAPGASSASYGIEVARMAGVPTPVVDRARDVVATMTGDASDSSVADNATDAADSHPTSDNDTATDPAASAAAADDALADALAEQTLDPETVAAVAAELQALDIATMTPLEALNTLDSLRSQLDEE